MQERPFALLDYSGNSGQHTIKIASIKEALEIGGLVIHDINMYVPTEVEPLELPLRNAMDTSADQKNVCLGQQTIRIWRTPWTVQHRGIWLPILDTDNRDAIPGEFIFVAQGTHEECRRRIVQQMNLRVAIISGTYQRPAPPLPAPQPSQAPRVSQATSLPPRFVAEIMKRDAISMKSDCPITMEPIQLETAVSITQCFHLFSKDAIHNWLSTKNSCPVCKAHITAVIDI